MTQIINQDYPNGKTVTHIIPAQAAGASFVEGIALAGFNGYVASAQYIPNAAIAGAASPNNRTLKVVNKGPSAQSGQVAATLTLDATQNLSAFTPKTIPVAAPPVDAAIIFNNYQTEVLPTPTAASFKTGDVLDYESDANGTGLADPGGLLVVVLVRDSVNL